MRKDIKNVEPVQPIRHKPRVSNHKTFGENIVHGDFTFNNHDYDQANWLVKIFGHAKFIRMFWRLFFPMLIWGVVTALVPILFMTMAKGVYQQDGVGIPIYESFSYTLSKFNYINIFVATAWTLMAYPIVGNYIGKNEPHKMQEAVRFVFYLIMCTCSIAMICEFIYAPTIAQAIVWKYSDVSKYDLSKLQLETGAIFPNQNAFHTYLTDLQRGFQLKYSTISIRYFAFTSYFLGWSSLFTPMFASKRNNRILVYSTIAGLVFFLIVYSGYLYGDVISNSEIAGTFNVNGTIVHEKICYAGYEKFEPLINISCGIYIGYSIVIPLYLTVYSFFPKFFKYIGIRTSNFFKNLYNSIVDKQSNIEYRISLKEYKKAKYQRKIKYYQDMIRYLTALPTARAVNKYYDEQERTIINKKNEIKINKYEQYLTSHKPKWDAIIAHCDVDLQQLRQQLKETKPTTHTLFYIDYDALKNIDDFERYYLWFSGASVPLRITPFKYFLIYKLHCHLWDHKNTQYFSFKVSPSCMVGVIKTSAGLFADQFAYGVFALALITFATNFNGNLLGMPGTTLNDGKEYYKLIVANASLISGYLGMVYNGFILLPQYFVSYYLGRNDRETAYHNSMLLMNWSFIVGIILCCIVLVYGSFVNYLIYPSNGATTIPVTWTGPGAAGKITFSQFWLDCFYMELILAIVEIFDSGTTVSFNILVAGGCKWTFFSDQFVRLVNIAVLVSLYYAKTDGVTWFNLYFGANMFIYYIVARSHSVIPAFICWIFIERGLALRSIDDEEKNISSNVLTQHLGKIIFNHNMKKKSKIYTD